MKTKIPFLFILCAVITFSCDQELSEKQTLSDIELTNFVLSDADFISYVSAKTDENSIIDENILNLSPTDKIALYQLIEKYSSYEYFNAQSSPDEKAFYESVFLVNNNKSNEYFNKLVSKLERYNYSALKLLELTGDFSVQFQTNGKTEEMSCEEIAMGAYVSSILNSVSAGGSIERARIHAETAYYWTLTGCIRGRTLFY